MPHSKNSVFNYPDRVYLFKEYDGFYGEKINPTKLKKYTSQLRLGLISMNEWEKDLNPSHTDI